MSAERTYHRAVLTVTEERATRSNNGFINVTEQLKVAEVSVAGTSPAEVLGQIERHVAELAEWHTQRERDDDVVDVQQPPMSVECQHRLCDSCDGQAAGGVPCQHDCPKHRKEATTDAR